MIIVEMIVELTFLIVELTQNLLSGKFHNNFSTRPQRCIVEMIVQMTVQMAFPFAFIRFVIDFRR